MNIKKLLALLMGVIMLLSLVGCGQDSGAADTTTQNTEEATPAGTLMVSMNASFEIIYDDEGNVLRVSGVNEAGKTAAAECPTYYGNSCLAATRGLLRYLTQTEMTGAAKVMTIGVKQGDPLPSDDFLDNLVTDTQYLADEESTGVQIRMFGKTDIDEQGRLLPEAAKALAGVYLGGAAADLVGEDIPVENVYTFSYEGKTCTVDAVTGAVTAVE